MVRPTAQWTLRGPATISIAEIIERARRGPILPEKDYDIRLSMALRRLVHDYGIKLVHEEIVPDDATASAIFDAGVDLLAEVGLYNTDTQRTLNFSREEALQVAEDTPQEETLGLGKDWLTIRARKPGDRRPPTLALQIQVPRWESFLRMLRAFAQGDGESGRLATALLASLEGVTNVAHAPGEIAWEVAHARWRQDEARRIGRPDMYLGIPNAVSTGAILAAFTSKGALRPRTGRVPLQIMPELKIDWDRLRLAVACQEMGSVPHVSCLTVLGAYCRGPEEAAVMLVANVLGQLAYSHGSIATLRAEAARGKDTSVDASAAAARAITLMTHIPISTHAFKTMVTAGLADMLYARAASAVAAVASGSAWLWSASCLAARGGGLCVSLDNKVIGAVYHSVAGMKRDQALDLFNKIEARYLDRLGPVVEGAVRANENIGLGRPFYEEDSLLPTQETLRTYLAVKDDLETLGIGYDDEEMGTFEVLTAREWYMPPAHKVEG
ncbi:MAG: monomethylamine:corrinoid methyltransferase [Chloroflexi bacterium]|nr:monomethylamine:corrinoid methyltransferase [Chloroflexota bacterium]